MARVSSSRYVYDIYNLALLFTGDELNNILHDQIKFLLETAQSVLDVVLIEARKEFKPYVLDWLEPLLKPVSITYKDRPDLIRIVQLDFRFGKARLLYMHNSFEDDLSMLELNLLDQIRTFVIGYCKKLEGFEGMDWRPTDTIPEDFYTV